MLPKILGELKHLTIFLDYFVEPRVTVWPSFAVFRPANGCLFYFHDFLQLIVSFPNFGNSWLSYLAI